MARLTSSSNFHWPPPDKRPEHRDILMICPDYRTSVQVKLEAFDISDRGRNIPYFRRMMVILDRVLKKPGIKIDQILNEFTQQQIDGIYPPLSPVMVQVLVEELELTGYLNIKNDQISSNPKGEVKLKEFTDSLTVEEKEALLL
jgi:hypothetical protein